MFDDVGICGTARREMELLAAGKGDAKVGALVLAQRDLARAEGALDQAKLSAALLAVCRSLSVLGREAEGLPLLERALALLDGGPQNDETAWSFGDAAYEMGKSSPTRAADLFGRALSLAGQAGSQIDPSLTEIWRKNRADALLEAGRAAEAEVVYRQALVIDRAIPRNCLYVGIIHLLSGLARACLAQGHYEDTDAAIEEGILDARARCGPTSTQVAELLVFRADCYRLQGALARAHAEERQAIAIYQQTLTDLAPQGSTMAPVVAKYQTLLDELRRRA